MLAMAWAWVTVLVGITWPVMAVNGMSGLVAMAEALVAEAPPQ
jgi:hypothetical protein